MPSTQVVSSDSRQTFGDSTVNQVGPRPLRQPNGHFMALDGLRGLAALVILVYHRRFWFTPGSFFHGFLAVDFFFILSGFVIAHAYSERLREGKLGFWRFLRLRLERLCPLLFFGSALGCGAILVTSAASIAFGALAPLGGAFILGGMSLPVPWMANPFDVNGPTWSLFFELIINVAFALVAGAVNNTRLYVTIATATILLIAMTVWTGTISVGFTWQSLPLGLIRVTAPFASGVALNRLWAAGRLPSFPAPFAVLCGAVGLVLCVPQLPVRWDLGYQLVCCLLVFPIVLVSGCQCRVGKMQLPVAALSAR